MANGGQNVIETVLRSVDEMGKDLANFTSRLKEIDQTGKSAGGTLNQMTQKSVNLQRQLVPLRSAVAQITTAVAVMNPQFSFAIGAVDNLTFAMINAARGAATFGAGLRAGLLAVLNPVTLTVLAVVAAIGFFIKSLIDAKQKKEEFDKAMKSGDVAFFAQQIEDASKEVEQLTEKYDKFLQKQQSQPTAQPLPPTIGDRLKERGLAADLTVAINKQTEAEKNYIKAQEERIKKILPALKQQLQNQLELVGATDKERIAIEARQAQEALVPKALEQLTAEEVKGLIAKLESAKATDLGTKANKSYTESLQNRIDALDIEIVKLGQGEAAAKRFANALERQRTREKIGVIIAARPELLEREISREQERVKLAKELSDVMKRLNEEEEEQREGRRFTFEDLKALNAEELKRIDIVAQIDLTKLESQRDNLANQLQILKETDAPYKSILETAVRLSGVERDILKTKAAQLDAQAKILDSEQKFEEARLARAQAEAIRAKIPPSQIGDILKDVDKRAQEDSLRVGQSIADGILTGLEGGEKSILDFMASLGRNMVRELLTELFAGLLRGQMQQGILAGGTAGGGGGGILGMFGGGGGISSLLGMFGGGGFGARPEGMFGPLMEGGGFFSNIFGWLGSLLGFAKGGMVLNPMGMQAFAHGGMVLNPRSVRAFQHGGMVTQGPVMGVVGEEGDELVARMKPGRPGEFGDERPIEQRFFFVDQRQRLRPGDVEFIITDSVNRERDAGKAVKNMIRRTRAG